MSEPRKYSDWLIGALMLLGTASTLSSTANAENEVYEDHKWGFTISQPEGWRLQPSDANDGDDIRVSMYGADFSYTGETCNVTVTDTPASRSFTQASIIAAVNHGAFAATALNDLRKIDPAATLLSARVINLGQLNAQQVEVKESFPAPHERKIEMISVVTAVAIPGRTYFVNCNTGLESYKQLKPELDRFEQSLRIGGKQP